MFCLETKKNHQLHSNKMAIVFVRGAHNVFMWFFAYTLWLILQPCRMIYEFASVLRNLNTIPPLFFAFDMLLLFLLVPIFLQQNSPTPKSRFSILFLMKCFAKLIPKDLEGRIVIVKICFIYSIIFHY